MATKIWIRDRLTCDGVQIGKMNPSPGDILVLCARDLTLTAFLPDYHYMIVADQLTVAPNAQTAIVGNDRNPAPNIVVLARKILGQLLISSTGVPGAVGQKGQAGDPAQCGDEFDGHRGDSGGIGGPGGNGGSVRVHYSAADAVPQANSYGGPGGPGGRGGPGGAPCGRGRWGKGGPQGSTGPTGPGGTAIISQVPEQSVWDLLDSPIARQWASYRVEVGRYLYRKFDNASLILAIMELKAAMVLDPGNADAQLIVSRIVQQLIPSCLARDLDIALDYADMARDVNIEAALVQNTFAAFQNASNTQQIWIDLARQLDLTIGQLRGQKQTAKLKAQAARQEVNITKTQSNMLAAQIRGVQAAIDNSKGFSLGALVTTVGAVAAAVGSIATGVGAIVTIPGAIATLSEDLDDADSFIDFLTESENKPDFSDLGKGLEGLVQARNGLVNLNKVISDLSGANEDGSNGQLAKLAQLVKEKKIADLRVLQSQTLSQAADLEVTNLTAVIANGEGLQSQWSTEIGKLDDVAEMIISLARVVADKVAEDAFLSFRALEIYQLETPPDVRFDYGYIHPDDDRDLPPAVRAAACEASLSRLAKAIISGLEIYSHLNVSEIQGFDVTHPVVPFSITDPQVLSHFGSGGGLQFSTVGMQGLPSSTYELKVDSIGLELVGATANSPVNVWVEHSGHWVMVSRKDQSRVEFNLLPHTEAIICRQSSIGITGQTVPSHPNQSGPPFSFWGRGVLAEWRIYPDAASDIDSTQLTAINLQFNCLGYTAAGHHQPMFLIGSGFVVPPDVQLLDSSTGFVVAVAAPVGVVLPPLDMPLTIVDSLENLVSK